MLENIPRRPGRPRKVLPPPPRRAPLTHLVSQWMQLTGWSYATTLRAISAGELKAVRNRGRRAPYRILTSEYVRHGFIQNINELIEPDTAVPIPDRPAAASGTSQEG